MTWPTAPAHVAKQSGFNYPRSGLNNVAEYMASGLPFVTQSTVASGSVARVDFPFVTNFFTVKNNSADTLSIGFTKNGVLGSNKFTLATDTSFTGDIRIKTLWLATDGGAITFEVIAGLTQIATRGYPVLTGSAAGFNTSSVDNVYGYDGLG